MQSDNNLVVLRIVLGICAVWFLLGILGVVLPQDRMSGFFEYFVGEERVEELFESPSLFLYCLRASCVAFVWLGVLFLLPLKDPLKYSPLIMLGIGFLGVYGVCALVWGILYGLHFLWFVVDSLVSFGLAFLLWRFRPVW